MSNHRVAANAGARTPVIKSGAGLNESETIDVTRVNVNDSSLAL